MSSKMSIDPNVKVPAAVAAAAAQSDEIHKQVYQPADPPADPPPAAEVKPVEPTAPAAPAAPAAPQVDEKSWEHRYQSMKGRYDRAAATLREQGEQIANLQALIANMQAAPPPAPAAELRPESFLTPAEIENYGEDFINVVKKAAKEIAGAEIAALQNKIAGLEGRVQAVTGSVVQDATQKFFDTMDRELPGWRQQNDDPNFISWLGLPDPYSGAIRHELLKTAYEQKNAPRVLAFFKGFLAEEAATSPAHAAEPDATPTVEKVPLEALAAPGRAKTAATTPPAEKPFITSAQITKFYADKAAGRYRGREDEANQFERQIFDAQRDGRIRN